MKEKRAEKKASRTHKKKGKRAHKMKTNKAKKAANKAKIDAMIAEGGEDLKAQVEEWKSTGDKSKIIGAYKKYRKDRKSRPVKDGAKDDGIKNITKDGAEGDKKDQNRPIKSRRNRSH